MPEPGGVMYAYPWDVYDHGLTRVLDELEACGMGAVQLSFSYHLATFFNPRNPRRKLRYGEPGVLEFDPRGSPGVSWPFDPVVSREVTGEHYMNDLVAALSGRGLGVIAWVVYLYNHAVARRDPDLAVENVFGARSEAHLCPANPAVREYALALTEAVLAHASLSGLVVESLSYAPYDHGSLNLKAAVTPGPSARMLLSLCFCRHCAGRAADRDVDVAPLRREIVDVIERELADLPDGPAVGEATEAWCRQSLGLARLLDARAEAASSLQATVLSTARGAGLRTSTNSPGTADERLTGVPSTSVSELLSDVRFDALPHMSAEETARAVAAAGSSAGRGATVFALAQLSRFADERSFRSSLEAAAHLGVRQFRFYEYGLLSERHLTWLRNAKHLWSGAGLSR